MSATDLQHTSVGGIGDEAFMAYLASGQNSGTASPAVMKADYGRWMTDDTILPPLTNSIVPSAEPSPALLPSAVGRRVFSFAPFSTSSDPSLLMKPIQPSPISVCSELSSGLSWPKQPDQSEHARNVPSDDESNTMNNDCRVSRTVEVDSNTAVKTEVGLPNLKAKPLQPVKAARGVRTAKNITNGLISARGKPRASKNNGNNVVTSGSSNSGSGIAGKVSSRPGRPRKTSTSGTGAAPDEDNSTSPEVITTTTSVASAETVSTPTLGYSDGLSGKRGACKRENVLTYAKETGKNLMKLEKNRMSARMCRARKKEFLASLKSDLEKCEAENDVLREELENALGRINSLEKELITRRRKKAKNLKIP